jgi:hypothetical protein
VSNLSAKWCYQVHAVTYILKKSFRHLLVIVSEFRVQLIDSTWKSPHVFKFLMTMGDSTKPKFVFHQRGILPLDVLEILQIAVSSRSFISSYRWLNDVKLDLFGKLGRPSMMAGSVRDSRYGP